MKTTKGQEMNDPTRAQLADPLWWDEHTTPRDKAWVVNTLTGEEYFTTGLVWDRNVMNVTVRPCKVEPEQAPETEYLESLKAMRDRIGKPTATPYQPEVGECECTYPTKWTRLYYVGMNQSGEHVVEVQGELMALGSMVKFRPIKSDEELFVEKGIKINRELPMGATEMEMFEALFKNGFTITPE